MWIASAVPEISTFAFLTYTYTFRIICSMLDEVVIFEMQCFVEWKIRH